MGGEEKQAYFSIRVCRRIVITEMPRRWKARLKELWARYMQMYRGLPDCIGYRPFYSHEVKERGVEEDVLLCETLVKKFWSICPPNPEVYSRNAESGKGNGLCVI